MRTVVGVLRGGPDSEYEISLKSGSSVLQHLDKEKYDPRDIFIDREGHWHSRGVPMEPEKALADIDVAFNGLHGEYGASRVQQILVGLNVPFTASSALGAAQARQPMLARQSALAAEIKAPYAIIVELDENRERAARRLFRSFPLPLAVRFGQTIAVARDYHELEQLLTVAPPKVLVEEYISGRPAQIGVVDDFRGEKTYALIPLPAAFSRDQKDELIHAAKTMHETLGLKHYSLMRFNVTPRGIYFAEADAQPELHEDAVLPQALTAVGASMPHFLDHVIQLARNGRTS